MRILHILDHSLPVQSDYALRVRAVLEQQRAIGLETYQLTSARQQGANARVEDVEGFRFFRTPEPRAWYARLPLLAPLAVMDSLAKRLGEVVEDVRPDILHVHSPALNGFATLRVAQWHSLPVVYECLALWAEGAIREGSLHYRALERMETHLFKRSETITTVSEKLRREIMARGIPAAKIAVIPDAVDLQRRPVAAETDEPAGAESELAGKTVLGFSGGFQADEGLALLLRALPAILERNPEVRLLLMGEGPEEHSLRELAARLGIQDWVVFAGRMDDGRAAKYPGQVAISVFPHLGRSGWRASSKPLEAMADGRLVIASDIDEHRELIANRETGWLFRAGDLDELVRTLREVLEHPSRWPEIKQAARRHVEEHRSWAANARRYEAVYRSIFSF